MEELRSLLVWPCGVQAAGSASGESEARKTRAGEARIPSESPLAHHRTDSVGERALKIACLKEAESERQTQQERPLKVVPEPEEGDASA